MNEGQNDIYYITGKRTAAVSSNPFMETFRKNRFEFMYMIYPIDEYGIQQPREFDGKKLESVTKESLDIDDEEKKMEDLKTEFEPRTKLMKQVFGDTFGPSVNWVRIWTKTTSLKWSCFPKSFWKQLLLSEVDFESNFTWTVLLKTTSLEWSWFWKQPHLSENHGVCGKPVH